MDLDTLDKANTIRVKMDALMTCVGQLSKNKPIHVVCSESLRSSFSPSIKIEPDTPLYKAIREYVAAEWTNLQNQLKAL